ncbi:MAG: MFS transporter [Nitrososphaerales archaeon]
MTSILVVVAIGNLMGAIDGNIVSIALPKMALDLGSGVSLLSWVVTGYLIASGASVLQAGKMGDIYGRKKIFLAGLALFGLSSALVGVSLNIYEVIAFRVLQGVSGTLSIATGYPLIFDTFPPKRAAAAIGMTAAAWSAGAVAGPVVGGFLVAIGWRFIFFINVPIALIGVIIGIRSIPNVQGLREGTKGLASTLREINLASSLILALAITTALMWLTFFNNLYAVFAASGVIGFIIAEKKSSHPLLNRELMKSKGFVYALIGGTAIAPLAIGGVIYGMSYYFQTASDVTPEFSGVLIAPLPIALMLASVAAGRIYGRLKTPIMISFYGLLVMITGLFSLYVAILEYRSSILMVSALLVVVGTGGGLWYTPTITAILKFARPELTGVANGTASMLFNVGLAAGIAITTLVSALYLTPSVVSEIFLGNLSNLTKAEATAFGEGIGVAMLASAAVIVIALPFYILVAREQRKLAT